MKRLIRSRPDGLDRAILNYIGTVPQGATVPEINRNACPGRRENVVRYRVKTLHTAGLLKETRVFGRAVIFPVGDGSQRCEVVDDD